MGLPYTKSAVQLSLERAALGLALFSLFPSTFPRLHTMADSLTLRATLKGHAGWVTSIATPLDPASNMLLSASRCALDGTNSVGTMLTIQAVLISCPEAPIHRKCNGAALLRVYSRSHCAAKASTPTRNLLTLLLSLCSDKTILVWELERSESNYGYAKRSLKGHSHFVQDVVISSDGQFCLSASW